MQNIHNKTEYQICTKTVIDTSYPGVKFDANGVSSFFHDFNKNIKPVWEKKINSNFLEKNIIKIKKESEKKEFDCILGISGGVDSSFCYIN